MCIFNMTIPGPFLSLFLFKASVKCLLGNLCHPRWDISRPCGLCVPLMPAPRKAAVSPPWLCDLGDSGDFSRVLRGDPHCCRWVTGCLCRRALPRCFMGPGSVKLCFWSLSVFTRKKGDQCVSQAFKLTVGQRWPKKEVGNGRSRR